MLVFFRCVAEAVMENGVKGLASLVPGGEFACKVAASAYKKYADRKKEADQKKEIEALAQVGFENARNAAVEAVRQAMAEVARTSPQKAGLSDADRIHLELYLSQVPAAVQQSLKRPEDPTGRTVPPAFAINSPADVTKLLPPRAPRFKPGDALTGKPGWVLERPLGVGGFGEVWLARHHTMTALNGAVKFCHGQQARDLRHEGGVINRVMTAGAHPNIVPLKDVHLDGDPAWLMFEFVSGGDLADLIREWQRRSRDDRVSTAVQTLRQLAEAVAHFHGQTPAIVHRDLKPSNILFDPTSRKLRITDFGIGSVAARAALAEESRGATTAAGRLMSYMRGSHTPLYSSPQQRVGAAPDPRDDVHALGVIGYQLLTGQLEYGAGPDFAEDLKGAGTPDDLISLLGQCVAQRPDRRPATAAELLRLLSGVGAAKAAPAPPTPPASPPPASPTAPAAPAVPRVLPPPNRATLAARMSDETGARAVWEEAVEALLKNDFANWTARWKALCEVLGPERARKRLEVFVGHEKNEDKLVS